MCLFMSVCLSDRLWVRMEQLGSYRNDFHEIRYLSIFRRTAEPLSSGIRNPKFLTYLLSYLNTGSVS